MAPYEALYGRKCQTPLCWDDVGERKLEDVELIETTSKKTKIIRDIWRRPLEFEVRDMVSLKIAP